MSQETKPEGVKDGDDGWYLMAAPESMREFVHIYPARKSAIPPIIESDSADNDAWMNDWVIPEGDNKLVFGIPVDVAPIEYYMDVKVVKSADPELPSEALSADISHKTPLG